MSVVKAEGGFATVTQRELPDGTKQVTAAILPDGTEISRTADGKLISNAGSPQETTWKGDMRIGLNQELQFVYEYEKIPSQANIEIRLPDNSRVAIKGPDGVFSLPGTVIGAGPKSLPESALSSVESLGLNISAERLKLNGIAPDVGALNTSYTLELTAAEAAQVKASIRQQDAFTLVGPEQKLAPQPVATSADLTIVQADGKTVIPSENKPGEYVYSSPRPDHTATVSYVFMGEDGRWKVLTGTRADHATAFPNKEALPGGFVDIAGSTAESPVGSGVRELREETGVKAPEAEVVRVADARLDPRNRVIDTQLLIMGDRDHLPGPDASTDKELKTLHVQDAETLLKSGELAFDHREALAAAIKRADEHVAWAKQEAARTGAYWDPRYPDRVVTTQPDGSWKAITGSGREFTESSPGPWDVKLADGTVLKSNGEIVERIPVVAPHLDAAGRRELATLEEQTKYWNERVQSVGVHTFKKTNGDYGTTIVDAKQYPEGLFLSYTDGKIKMEQDVKLPDGSSIKAGTELPAGIRLYRGADSKWVMQLPQGNEYKLGEELKFSGGQTVAPGRVILSRPSIDERGHLCIDTYTQSQAEINKFYHRDGNGRVRLNVDIQTDRTMVPIDPNHPIVLKSYDGATMDHNGKAWMVKIPDNFGGGFYIIAEKDLMPLFEGTEPKAVEAHRQFHADLQEKIAQENTAKATNVDYFRQPSQMEMPFEAKEYMKVQTVQAEFLTAPTAWANRYGVRGEVPVEIAMPGALKIYETKGNLSDWYVADAKYAATSYREVSPGEFIKTTPFLAEPLLKTYSTNGFSGVAGDYLVTPLKSNGLPNFSAQYIVEANKFESMNAPRADVERALAEHARPLSIAETEALNRNAPSEIKPVVRPAAVAGEVASNAVSNAVWNPGDKFKPTVAPAEVAGLPPVAATTLEALAKSAEVRSPFEKAEVERYMRELGLDPKRAVEVQAKTHEGLSKGLPVLIALGLALGLATSASAANGDQATKRTTYNK